MTREKKNAIPGHFSKDYSICVNEKTLEGNVCGSKQKKERVLKDKAEKLPCWKKS